MIATVKHPVMAGRDGSVKLALESPDEARQSRTDPAVLLFFKAETPKRWTCAVIKRTDNAAFLVTAYPTDAIKEGAAYGRREGVLRQGRQGAYGLVH